MGFLDGLCDYDDGEADISWSTFWRLQNLCSLTTLGAVVPCVAALVASILCLVTTRWATASSSSQSSANNNGSKLDNPHQRSLNDAGASSATSGREESKGEEEELHDDFSASASEPLLGFGRANQQEGSSGLRGEVSERFGDGDEEEEARLGTPKKGTGVHWLKLLLYWTQAAYHVSVGAYDLVDGHADDPYKCEYEYR